MRVIGFNSCNPPKKIRHPQNKKNLQLEGFQRMFGRFKNMNLVSLDKDWFTGYWIPLVKS